MEVISSKDGVQSVYFMLYLVMSLLLFFACYVYKELDVGRVTMFLLSFMI